jgi:hypothetical protein
VAAPAGLHDHLQLNAEQLQLICRPWCKEKQVPETTSRWREVAEALQKWVDQIKPLVEAEKAAATEAAEAAATTAAAAAAAATTAAAAAAEASQQPVGQPQHPSGAVVSRLRQLLAAYHEVLGCLNSQHAEAYACLAGSHQLGVWALSILEGQQNVVPAHLRQAVVDLCQQGEDGICCS